MAFECISAPETFETSHSCQNYRSKLSERKLTRRRRKILTPENNRVKTVMPTDIKWISPEFSEQLPRKPRLKSQTRPVLQPLSFETLSRSNISSEQAPVHLTEEVWERKALYKRGTLEGSDYVASPTVSRVTTMAEFRSTEVNVLEIDHPHLAQHTRSHSLSFNKRSLNSAVFQPSVVSTPQHTSTPQHSNTHKTANDPSTNSLNSCLSSQDETFLPPDLSTPTEQGPHLSTSSDTDQQWTNATILATDTPPNSPKPHPPTSPQCITETPSY